MIRLPLRVALAIGHQASCIKRYHVRLRQDPPKGLYVEVSAGSGFPRVICVAFVILTSRRRVRSRKGAQIEVYGPS